MAVAESLARLKSLAIQVDEIIVAGAHQRARLHDLNAKAQSVFYIVTSTMFNRIPAHQLLINTDTKARKIASTAFVRSRIGFSFRTPVYTVGVIQLGDVTPSEYTIGLDQQGSAVVQSPSTRSASRTYWVSASQLFEGPRSAQTLYAIAAWLDTNTAVQP